MIITIGTGGCGFTFLNWSISYLRGDVEYTNLNGKISKVIENPLDNLTAHKFYKDHIVHNLSNTHLLHNATEQSIIYVVPADRNNFNYYINLPGKKVVFDNKNYCQELFARHITTVPPMGHDNLKGLFDRLCSTYPVGEVKATMLDFSGKILKQHYDIPNNVYVIDYNDMFNQLDSKIFSLFEYLELSISKDRLDPWYNVYCKYRLKNQGILEKFKKDVTFGSTRVFKDLFNG